MTPLLLAFGYPAPVAIGTDLLYAAITKAGGAWAQHKSGNVHWPIVLLLALGSVPTSIFLHSLVLDVGGQSSADFESLLTKSLGVMLVVTAIILIFREKLRFNAINGRPAQLMSLVHKHSRAVTFLMGVILGVCVTLSSVGAGAFCAAILLIIYSKTPASQIIATDIAHAVPLTFIAGLGYLLAGTVDVSLLLSLLIGSLPAIHLGSKVSNAVPDRLLQQLLIILLLGLGVYYSVA